VTIPERLRHRVNAGRLGVKKLQVYPSQQATTETRSSPPVWAKGIYVTAWSAGSRKRLGKLIALVDQTELNARGFSLSNDKATPRPVGSSASASC